MPSVGRGGAALPVAKQPSKDQSRNRIGIHIRNSEGDPTQLAERIHDMEQPDEHSVDGRIVLELSRRQVATVLREAGAGGAPSTLLSGLDAASPRSLSASVDELLSLAEADERHLSRSLLSGLLVLACFPLDGTPLGVAQLARRLDMSPSAAHRYISTLLAAELLERNPDSRRYRLARKHAKPDPAAASGA
jgi:DNA-binding transcriptional ArsR family regulator